MIKPIPNVLYNKEKEAVSRLYEFKIEKLYVETNKTLPGRVFEYYRKGEEDTVILKIAKKPVNSFSYHKDIEYVWVNKFVTGPNSINSDLLNKAMANATDLGIPVDLNDSIIYLYGDTFSGNDCNIGMWNSNFIAQGSDIAFNDGIKFDRIICDKNGIVKPICQGLHHRDKVENKDLSLKREVTKIPTGGILVGEYVYIYMMHVRHWGDPGVWYVTDNQLYKAHKYKLDEFKKVETGVFNCTKYERVGQLYPFKNDKDPNYIYLLGIPGGRFGNLSLLRVKEENIENKDLYEICVNEGKWENINTGINKPYYILSPNVSEPCIMFNNYLNKWIISSIGEDGHYFYLSDKLDVPFKEKMKILTHEELVSFYGGFIHPRLSDYDGQKLYVQYSQWSPIYNTSVIEVVFKDKD